MKIAANIGKFMALMTDQLIGGGKNNTRLVKDNHMYVDWNGMFQIG